MEQGLEERRTRVAGLLCLAFFSSVPEPKLLGVEWVNGRQAVVVANEAFPQSTGCWQPP